jgi:hypothetical protein
VRSVLLHKRKHRACASSRGQLAARGKAYKQACAGQGGECGRSSAGSTRAEELKKARACGAPAHWGRLNQRSRGVSRMEASSSRNSSAWYCSAVQAAGGTVRRYGRGPQVATQQAGAGRGRHSKAGPALHAVACPVICTAHPARHAHPRAWHGGTHMPPINPPWVAAAIPPNRSLQPPPPPPNTTATATTRRHCSRHRRHPPATAASHLEQRLELLLHLPRVRPAGTRTAPR